MSKKDVTIDQNSPLFSIAEEMKAFPQGKYYNDAQIKKWADAIEAFDPGRLTWHLKRLTGIGGSEIGVLTGDLEGDYHPHQSTIEICKAKLLQLFPEPPTGDMLRGQMMEDMARDIYRKQILGRYPNAKPREDIMDELSGFRHPDHEWMVGNPDEIMELEPGKLFVIDYKCPTQISFESIRKDGPPDYYVAQLHHYTLLAEAKGYKIAGLQLASLDYKNFNVLIQDIPVSQEQLEKNIFAGDHFWNEYIMKNRLPESLVSRRFGDRGELPDNLVDFAVDYTILRHLGNIGTKMSDKITALTKEANLSLDSGIDDISIGLVKIKSKRTFDEQALEAAIVAKVPTLDPTVLRDEAKLDGDVALRHFIESHGYEVPKDDDKKGWAALAADPKMAPVLKAPQLNGGRLAATARQIGLDVGDFIVNEDISFGLPSRPSKRDPYAMFMHEKIGQVLGTAVENVAEAARDQLFEFEKEFHSSQVVAKAKRRAGPR